MLRPSATRPGAGQQASGRPVLRNMDDKFTHCMAGAALAASLFTPLPVLADVASDSTSGPWPAVSRKPSMFKFGFERIKLSGNESMGMIGSTYLVEVLPGLRLGPAAYGAITGQRGGFFTAGGEAALQQNMTADLALQGGVFVGGGGGGSASMVGGGLMVRPHLDLLWKLGAYRAGVSASRVSFPNGTAASNQIGVVLAADSSLAYVAPAHAGERMDVGGRHGAGFDRILAVAGRYAPRHGTTNLSGAPSTGSIGYAGVRLERLLSPSMYWGMEATGASSGGAAGYAELLGTLGIEMPARNDLFSVGARLALGMGGGGQVSVGGGQLRKLGAYAGVNISRSTHLSLEGGYATAPSGRFRAGYASANLIWDLDHPGASGRGAGIARNEWSIGTEHYFAAAHNNGSKRDLNAVAIKLDRYLNDSIYLTGQAHSAYSGNSGGYSAGLFGAGYATPKFLGGLSGGAEMLVGAAGGGSLDTAGGAIVQPMAYLRMDLGEVVGIRLGAGRVRSLKGALNSNVADLVVNFAFGTASR